jgi:hypothetical protein
MSDPLPDWFRFIVVPILIGFISSIVGFFLTGLSAKLERTRAMREMQTSKAISVCTKVIDCLDVLHSNLKYNAWYVTWRKALPPSVDYVGSDLHKADEQQWKDYNVALANLREHQIEFETDLKGYFGANGIEPKLFMEIDAVVNEIADKLSMIYHSKDIGGSPTMWLGQGAPCLEIPKEGFTEKDRSKSRDEFAPMFAFTSSRIKILAQTMIACIQKGSVGTMRIGPEPELPPDQVRELKQTELSSKTPLAPEQP